MGKKLGAKLFFIVILTLVFKKNLKCQSYSIEQFKLVNAQNQTFGLPESTLNGTEVLHEIFDQQKESLQNLNSFMTFFVLPELCLERIISKEEEDANILCQARSSVENLNSPLDVGSSVFFFNIDFKWRNSSPEYWENLQMSQFINCTFLNLKPDNEKNNINHSDFNPLTMINRHLQSATPQEQNLFCDNNIIFYEDFESLQDKLKAPEDETMYATAWGNRAWTHTPPAGWSVINIMPGYGNNFDDGITEWSSWSFTNYLWWIISEGEKELWEYVPVIIPMQGRQSLYQSNWDNRITKIVAVCDPDEQDDEPHIKGWFNTSLYTPPIDISAQQPNSLTLFLDSSFNPWAEQIAHIYVIFDASQPIEIAQFSSDPLSINYTVFNPGKIEISIGNPLSANSMQIIFRFLSAGNDWFWAIGNIGIYQKVCVKCQGDCLECLNSAQKCTKCTQSSGKYLKSSSYECVSIDQCPYYASEKNQIKECVDKCDSQFAAMASNKLCQPCDVSCYECQAPLDPSQCLSCSQAMAYLDGPPPSVCGSAINVDFYISNQNDFPCVNAADCDGLSQDKPIGQYGLVNALDTIQTFVSLSIKQSILNIYLVSSVYTISQSDLNNPSLVTLQYSYDSQAFQLTENSQGSTINIMPLQCKDDNQFENCNTFVSIFIRTEMFVFSIQNFFMRNIRFFGNDLPFYRIIDNPQLFSQQQVTIAKNRFATCDSTPPCCIADDNTGSDDLCIQDIDLISTRNILQIDVNYKEFYDGSVITRGIFNVSSSPHTSIQIGINQCSFENIISSAEKSYFANIISFVQNEYKSDVTIYHTNISNVYFSAGFIQFQDMQNNLTLQSINIQNIRYSRFNNESYISSLFDFRNINSQRISQIFVNNSIFNDIQWMVSIFAISTFNKFTVSNSQIMNVHCGERGCFVKGRQYNLINTTNLYVYNVSALYFGAFLFVEQNNIIYFNSSESHYAKAKIGGFFYLMTNNTLNINNVIASDFEVNHKGGYLHMQESNILNVNYLHAKNCLSRDGCIFGSRATNRAFINHVLIENVYVASTGAVYWARDDITYINNMTTRNTTCGGIYKSGSKGLAQGGVFYLWTESIFVITNSNFISAKALTGGVVYQESISSVSFTNTNFTNVTATDSGGGIYMMGTLNRLYINHSYVTNANAVKGGFIFMKNSASVNIANLQANNCSAQQGGFAHFAQVGIQGSQQFLDSSFQNMIADYGGSIYSSDNSNIVVQNLTVSNVSANLKGGFICINSNNYLSIINSSFIKINSNNGGIVYSLDKNQVVLDGLIANNLKALQGSVINAFSNSNINLTNSIITDITADGDGGVVNAFDNNVIVFLNNVVDRAASGQNGGVIYGNQFTDLTFENCAIRNVSSEQEGGIIKLGKAAKQFLISNNKFENIYSFDGGGILSYDGYQSNDGAVQKIQNNSIRNVSTMGIGGAFLIKNKAQTIIISDCALEMLNSKLQGGCFSIGNDNEIQVLNSNFSYITSSTNGGLINCNSNNNFTLINVKITQIHSANQGGLLYAQENNNVYIMGLNLTNSYIDLQKQMIYLITNNNLTISNANFQNSSSLVLIEQSSNNINLQDSTIHDIKCKQQPMLDITGSSNNQITVKSTLFYNIFSAYEFLSVQPLQTLQLTQTTQQAFLNQLQFINVTFNNITIDSNQFIRSSQTLMSFQDSKFYAIFQLFYLQQQNLSNGIAQNNQQFTYFYLDSSNITMRNTSFVMGNKNNINILYQAVIFQIQQTNYVKIELIGFNFDLINIPISGYIIIDQSSLMNDDMINVINGSNNDIIMQRCNFIIRQKVFDLTLILAQNVNLQMVKSFSQGFGQNGAVKLTNSNFEIKKSIFVDSTSVNNGGVFFIAQSSISSQINSQQIISQSQFILSTTQVFGGAIYIENYTNISSLVFSQNAFKLNRAVRGGALSMINNRVMNLTSNSYTSNIGTNYRNPTNLSLGGAVYIEQQNDIQFAITFQNNSYFNNQAEMASVVYLNIPQNNLLKSKQFINDQQQFTYNLNYNNNNKFDQFVRFADETISNNIASLYDQIISFPKQEIIFSNNQQTALLQLKTGSSELNGIITTPCLVSIGQRSIEDFKYINVTQYEFYRNIYVRNTQSQSQTFTNILDFKEDEFNSYSFSLENGNICLQQAYRKDFPINNYFELEIINIYSSSKLVLQLDFQLCSLGEQLHNQPYSCNACPLGYYSFEREFVDLNLCMQCRDVDPFYCLGGANVTPKQGYWSDGLQSISFQKCLNDFACLGDTSSKYIQNIYTDKNVNNALMSSLVANLQPYGSCYPGYTGKLCNECQEGYGKLNTNNQCAKCLSSTYILTSIFGILVALIMLFFSVVNSTRMINNLLKGMDNYTKIMLTNLMKILVTHVQLMQIIFIFPLNIPQFTISFMSFASNIQPNLSQAFSLDCLLKQFGVNNFAVYLRLIIGIAYPVIIVFAIALIFNSIYTARLNKKQTEEETKKYGKITFVNDAILIFIIVMSFSIKDVIEPAIKLFECHNVGDLMNTDLRLSQDYGIKCQAIQHNYWQYFGGLPLLISIGFFYPAGIFFRLRSQALSNPELEQKSLENSLMISDSSNSDSSVKSIIPEESPENLQKMLKDPNSSVYPFRHSKLSQRKNLYQYGFLYITYKPKYFYWDFVTVTRKILTLLFVAFMQDPIRQKEIYPMLVMSVLYIPIMYIHYKKQPYSEQFQEINKIEETALFTQSFSLLILIFIRTLENTNNANIYSFICLAVIALLNLRFLFCIGKVILLHYCQQLYQWFNNWITKLKVVGQKKKKGFIFSTINKLDQFHRRVTKAFENSPILESQPKSKRKDLGDVARKSFLKIKTMQKFKKTSKSRFALGSEEGKLQSDISLNDKSLLNQNSNKQLVMYSPEKYFSEYLPMDNKIEDNIIGNGIFKININQKKAEKLNPFNEQCRIDDYDIKIVDIERISKDEFFIDNQQKEKTEENKLLVSLLMTENNWLRNMEQSKQQYQASESQKALLLSMKSIDFDTGVEQINPIKIQNKIDAIETVEQNNLQTSEDNNLVLLHSFRSSTSSNYQTEIQEKEQHAQAQPIYAKQQIIQGSKRHQNQNQNQKFVFQDQINSNEQLYKTLQQQLLQQECHIIITPKTGESFYNLENNQFINVKSNQIQIIDPDKIWPQMANQQLYEISLTVQHPTVASLKTNCFRVNKAVKQGKVIKSAICQQIDRCQNEDAIQNNNYSQVNIQFMINEKDTNVINTQKLESYLILVLNLDQHFTYIKITT